MESTAWRVGRVGAAGLVALAVAMAAGCGEGGDDAAPDPEGTGAAGAAAPPAAGELLEIYERSNRALAEADSAAYLATLAPERRSSVTALLERRGASFADFARLALRLGGPEGMEVAGTRLDGDTAALVLRSEGRDTVMRMGDVSILDHYVREVRFLPGEDGWGIARIDGAHKPEWMTVDAFLASRRSAGSWRHPRAAERSWAVDGGDRGVRAVGVALDDGFLHLRFELPPGTDSSRVDGLRLYVDVDDDPATGSQGRPGVSGDLPGWERELTVGWEADEAGGSLSVEVKSHAAVAAITSHEEAGVTPEADSNVRFTQGQGWVRWEGADLLVRLPASLVEAPPTGRFAFLLVDPLAPGDGAPRFRYPSGG